jgi:hypothetical protein
MVVEMKNIRNFTELSNEQQEELQRHYDGENSIFERWKMKLFLARSQPAQRYLHDLEDVSTRIQSYHQSRLENSSISLWDRIERRVDEEDRATLLLGKRRLIQNDNHDKIDGWRVWASRIVWSGSGACFASILTFLLLNTSSEEANKFLNPTGSTLASTTNSSTAAQGEGTFKTVKLERSMDLNQAPVEIDWLHSDGTVHLIQSKERQIPTIWVKRQRFSIDGARQKSSQTEVPLVINVSGQ